MRRLRYAWIVIVALGRALLASRRGRWVLAVLGAVAVVWHFVPGAQATTRSAKWSGFGNMFAPTSGTLTLEGVPGKAMRCTFRGETGMAIGDGWVFRGDASAEETSCEGELARNGRVAAVLKVRLSWRGRVKGIGGDWEDVAGGATCEGQLTGSLASGGDWAARCKNHNGEWSPPVTWTVDRD